MAQAAIPYHRKVAQTPRRELAHHWMRRGKFWLLPLLLSDYGREIIDHKYDAFVTDRAYENVPSGLLGPVGQLIDYVVLQQDIHVGLRQRLQLVVEESAHVVRTLWAQGHPQVRMVSAPCGLARDLRAIWQQLDRPTAARLRVHGLDLDERGDVLPTAQTLANAIGMPLRTSRCDLLNTGQDQSRARNSRQTGRWIS